MPRRGSSGVSGSEERQPWVYGVNDHIGDDVLEKEAKAASLIGRFRADFGALCQRCGVVPHAAFLPGPGSAPEAAEPSTLSVQSVLMDRAHAQVLRHALAATTELRTLRLSSCCLDAEMLGWLRQGLSETCTVTTLHLDWNPLEVPYEDPAEARRAIADASPEDLDELERRRFLRQAERELRNLGERLEARAGGDLQAALLAVALDYTEPDQVGLAYLHPVDQQTWAHAFVERLGLPLEEAQRSFELLDGPQFGHSDGLVGLGRLESTLRSLREKEEPIDPIAAAFASLIDATSLLEVVSLRYCNLGRVEAMALGKALGSPSPHLKAVNLWGNNICDRGAEALGKAFETNFGLQYLGLGRNLISHVGLRHLCSAIGVTRIGEKPVADPIIKALKEQAKDRDKKLKAAPPPKVDGSGRERYKPALYVPTCEDFKDEGTNQTYWLWTRNIHLKTLVLEHNPIADAQAVWQLQPYGCGDLVLRATPCAEDLRALMMAGNQPAADAQPPANGSSSPPGAAPAEPPRPTSAFKGAASAVTGWRLVLQ